VNLQRGAVNSRKRGGKTAEASYAKWCFSTNEQGKMKKEKKRRTKPPTPPLSGNPRKNMRGREATEKGKEGKRKELGVKRGESKKRLEKQQQSRWVCPGKEGEGKRHMMWDGIENQRGKN